jgi:hypothetical protein
MKLKVFTHNGRRQRMYGSKEPRIAFGSTAIAKWRAIMNLLE